MTTSPDNLKQIATRLSPDEHGNFTDLCYSLGMSVAHRLAALVRLDISYHQDHIESYRRNRDEATGKEGSQ